MTKRQFSRAEIEYLRTLPSIDAVTDSRITYAREFQIDCMRRYLQGEKPTAIFISAGLSPSVIGHKRIERNIARWKRDEDIICTPSVISRARASSITSLARFL